MVERVETGSEGVVLLRNVPVRPASAAVDGTVLHFTGVERGLGGHIVRAFLHDDADDARPAEPRTRDDPRYLGELSMYASTVPLAAPGDRPESRPDLPEPLPLTTYETFIQVSDERLLRGADGVDILLQLTEPDGTPVPGDRFRFADLVVQSDRAGRPPRPGPSIDSADTGRD